MIRQTLRAQVRSLSDNEVEIIVSTDALIEQDGLMLMSRGCQLDRYKRNPIWLWSHDYNKPVGRADQIMVGSNNIAMRVRFAAPGISQTADEVRGLVKDGIVSAASVGFDFNSADAEPLDPKNPRGGRRVNKWVLYECSFVAVPADDGALVTARGWRAPPSERVHDPRYYDPPIPSGVQIAIAASRHAARVGQAGIRRHLDRLEFERRQAEKASLRRAPL